MLRSSLTAELRDIKNIRRQKLIWKEANTWFNKVHVSHCHDESPFWSWTDAELTTDSLVVSTSNEGVALSEDPAYSNDLDPHHKSSCSLLSAAIAAAWTGLSTALMLLSPPRRLGPGGNRASRWALFSAAARAWWRREDKGGWRENPPNLFPGRSNPCPVPVMPLAVSSSHS